MSTIHSTNAATLTVEPIGERLGRTVWAVEISTAEGVVAHSDTIETPVWVTDGVEVVRSVGSFLGAWLEAAPGGESADIFPPTLPRELAESLYESIALEFEVED